MTMVVVKFKIMFVVERMVGIMAKLEVEVELESKFVGKTAMLHYFIIIKVFEVDMLDSTSNFDLIINFMESKFMSIYYLSNL